LEALVQWDCRVLDMTPPAFHESVTSTAQLRELRAAASRWLSDSRIDDAAIETVALVLSETCTNAFIHGGADVVDVEITIVEMDGRRIDDHDRAAPRRPRPRRPGATHDDAAPGRHVRTRARARRAARRRHVAVDRSTTGRSHVLAARRRCCEPMTADAVRATLAR
jgi:hypothetical protein